MYPFMLVNGNRWLLLRQLTWLTVDNCTALLLRL